MMILRDIAMKVHKWLPTSAWVGLIVMNAALFIFNGYLREPDLMALNVLSAVGCFVGYVLSIRDKD
jgi:hypothetical protein